jgi:N-formylglutamate deformylase
MPSTRSPARRGKGHSLHADFVLGDRDGTTCAREFTDFVAQLLRRRGYTVRVNEVYKGVEIVRRHGRPRENRHSLQIEVDRALYMDQKTIEKSEGFAEVEADIGRLIAGLADFVRERLARHPPPLSRETF